MRPALSGCRDTLRDEPGVEPDHETERVYRDIVTDGKAGPQTPVEVMGEGSPSRSSIAILPFANLTGNDRLGFLCKGLAEEVSTGLGRFRSLFVIDRYSAATVASATSDTVEIGKRLGAAALLQGSIQATNSRLHIKVRLVDSTNRAQTLSDVLESATGDAPGIPYQIVSAIISTCTIGQNMLTLIGPRASHPWQPMNARCAASSIFAVMLPMMTKRRWHSFGTR
jgi:TolB-like protein